ncbi:MAG: type II secretion system protein GspN [Desulfobacteraceae bacterium]|jgi:type II secretion system protein N
MKRTTKIFLYVVFGLAALVLFLYLRFPSKIVKNTVTEQIKAIDPKAELGMDEVSLTIPPGLKIRPLSVDYAAQPIFHMDDLKVTPSLFSLFTTAKKLSYHGNIGSGELKGRAETAILNKREQTKVAMTLTRVPLNYIDLLNQWKSYTPEGELDATVNFDSLKAGGTADINLEISPTKISFNPPLMGIEALDFDRLNAQLIVTQRMLQIRHCEASGDQIEGKITGSIVFRKPISNSRITLSLTVKPQPAFIEDHKNDVIGGMLSAGNAQKRGVVFRISGTIQNPRYVIR